MCPSWQQTAVVDVNNKRILDFMMVQYSKLHIQMVKLSKEILGMEELMSGIV